MIAGRKVGSAARGEIGVQLVGLAAVAADTFHLPVERRLDLVHRALNFPCIGRLAAKTIQLFIDDALNVTDVLTWPCRRNDQERAAKRA